VARVKDILLICSLAAFIAVAVFASSSFRMQPVQLRHDINKLTERVEKLEASK
jgi:cell division protein FtsL